MDQQTSIWEHCLQHATLTDQGLRRANNQDAMAVSIASSQDLWHQRGHLFLVADGMGAHAAGELASKLAADTVPLTYQKRLELTPPEALLAAIGEANQRIYGRGQAEPDFQGMGTTCTVLLLVPQGALVAHVGDSRAYRLRGNRLEQLTFDHSLIWELRAAGQLSEDPPVLHIPKNIITRSLGPNPVVRVDLEGPFPVAVGDTFLLCSDGLSGQLKDEEIGVILGCLPPDEAVRALVDLANLRGGPDNITVIVARVTGPQIARGGGTDSSTGPAAPVRPVHPLIWTLLGVSALAAAGAAAMGYTLGVLAGLIGLALGGLAAVLQRYGGPGRFQFGAHLLGKGPHSSCVCNATADLAAQLRGVVEQLRAAASAQDRAVDWSRLLELESQAAAAIDAADYTAAVRAYLRAISFMMGELKRPEQPST